MLKNDVFLFLSETRSATYLMLYRVILHRDDFAIAAALQYAMQLLGEE